MTGDKKSSLGEFFVGRRYLIMIIVGLLTAMFLYGVTQRLSIQVLLEELIPPNHPFVKLHGEYEGAYGGTSSVMIAVVVKDGDIFNPATLQKIKRINDELFFYKDIRRSFIYSIAQRKSKVAKGHAGGMVDVSALMWPEIDTSPQGIARLKQNIYTSDLYNGVLVSKDGTAALIMADCWSNIDYNAFFDFIQNLKQNEEDDNTSIHVAGRPMLLGWIFHFMPKVYIILALTVLVIIIAVVSHFKNIVVIIPLLALALSTVWGFGMISLIGINFNPLMVVLAVLVAARAHSHSVQTTRRYLEELHLAGGDRVKAAAKTLDGIFLASLAAIVTDAAGFSVLILARIPMVQRIAILCAFWVVSILLISSIIGPILCIYMPIPKNLKQYDFAYSAGKSGKRTIMDIAADMCLGRSSIVIVVVMILIGLFAGTYDAKLKVGDTFPGSPILWPDSRYNQDCKMINEKFDNAGTDMINVIVEGAEDWTIQEPAVMKRIDRYTRYITHKHPDVVGGTQTVAKIVKTMNKEFHEGDVRYQSIPDDKRLISNLMFFYQMAGDPGDYTTLFEGRYKHTVIRVFLKDHTGDTLRKVVASTQEFFESQEPIKGVTFRYAAGYGGILAATNQEIAWSQTGTLLLVFLTVFVFCGLAYRSIVASILLCIPLLVANLVAFAYMVLKDIGLDVNVLPVSAVGIGVGVDYGIYILSRMEEEFKNTGGDWKAMTHTTLNSAGKGVVITAVTVIVPVLLWPLLADLKFQAEMGLLLSFIMFFDMLGALLFLPAAVNLLKPKFIARQAQKAVAGAYMPGETPAATELQTSAGNQLFAAVRKGDSKALQGIIEDGANVNIIVPDGSSLLMEAVRIPEAAARSAIVKMLLAAGAGVYAADKHNNTALHLAACYGFDETVRLLITGGADVNAGKTVADTPLGRAIAVGNITAIELLIQSGATVTTETLHYTVEQGGGGRPYIVEMILKVFAAGGVKLDRKDRNGLTALDYIKGRAGFEEIAKRLELLIQ